MRALLRPFALFVVSCLCFLTSFAQTVRVLTVSGGATIQAADGSPARQIVIGDTVTLGTRIVTAADGRVVITPFPGIKSIISPSSDLVIEKLSETKATGTNVALQQAVLNLKSGAIVSDLEKQEGVAYDYAIRTPRGVAGARGTTYTVAVALSGVESVIVTDGRIQITLASGATYALAPGQASVSRPGAPETAISNVSELPPADQKLLQTTLESSLGEIAKAIEEGVDLKPATLKGTLQFAEKVGIKLDPKLIESLESALEKERQKKPLEPKPTSSDRVDEKKNDQPPENKEGKQVVTEQQDPVLTAYLAELSLGQRTEFLSLPLTARTQLLAYYQTTPLSLRGNFARAPLAIQNTLLSSAQDFQLRDFSLIRTSDGSSRSIAEVNYFFGLGTANRAPFLAQTLADQRATVAYFNQIPVGLRSAFISAAPAIQATLLADATDLALASFALSPAADGSNRSLSEVTYFNSLPEVGHTAFLALSLDDQRATVAYFNQIPVGLRSAFISAAPAIQATLLADSTDLALASFALTPAPDGALRTLAEIAYFDKLLDARHAAFLALSVTDQRATVAYFNQLPLGQRSDFLAINADSQAILVKRPADSNLASFALTATEPGAYRSTAEISLYSGLSNITRIAYLQRPSDVQALLAKRADTDLANMALAADSLSGLYMTDNELRDALGSFNALTPAGFALFKEFAGGPGLPNIDNAPSPSRFSSAAYERTLNSWNALSAAQRATFLQLGAGESIMDTSAAYLAAVADSFSQQPAIFLSTAIETGWGAALTEILANKNLQIVLTNASTLTTEQKAIIKEFRIGPYAFDESSYNYIPATTAIAETLILTQNPTNPIIAYLDALAALSSADRAILKRLDLEDHLISPPSHSVDYPTVLQNTIGFYNQLTPSERDLLISLQAGVWLWGYEPTDTFYGPETTAVQPETVFDYMRSFLQNLSTFTSVEKEALRDLEILTSMQLGDNRLTIANIRQILGAYLDAPATVQPLLREQFKGKPWFESVIGAGGEYNVRPISEVIALLSALTPSEISALRDMQIGDTLAYGDFFDADFNSQPNITLTPVQQLKNMIAVYQSLGDLEKFTLRELGIIKSHENNFAAFLADPAGLNRLLKAYSELPGTLRANTQQIEPNGYGENYQGSSFFMPKVSRYGNMSYLYNVSFTSDDDLHVGATRHLRISGQNYEADATFVTGVGKSLYLRASDLLELNSVTFSNNIRSIVMEAATIHLQNLDFHAGSTIALNSKFGGAGVDGTGSGKYPVFVSPYSSAEFGRVNFDNVSYNGNPLIDASSYDAHGVNIRIGTLADPATPATTVIPVPAPNPVY